MFSSRYQGGAAVEIVDVVGTHPLAAWRVSHASAVRRVYDRAVRGYAHVMDGGPHTSLQLPKQSHQKLSLEQPFLVLQIKFNAAPALCSLELCILDSSNTRRRVLLSSAASSPSVSPMQARLPLGDVAATRETWLNLCIDMPNITAACFQNEFRSLEGIVLRPQCSFRKVFTLRCPPADIETGHLNQYSILASIPRTLDLPSGVIRTTRMVNWESICPPAALRKAKQEPIRSPAPKKSVAKRSRRLIEARSQSRENSARPPRQEQSSKTPRKPVTRRRLTISPVATKAPSSELRLPLSDRKPSPAAVQDAPTSRLLPEDAKATPGTVQSDGAPSDAGPGPDDDPDVVLMGELSDGGADACSGGSRAPASSVPPKDAVEWNTDDDEIDFVQNALQFYKHEHRRPTSSRGSPRSSRVSIESVHSWARPQEVAESSESTTKAIRQRLRPIQHQRPVATTTRSEPSSRSSSTSTCSRRATTIPPPPSASPPHERAPPPKPALMFDPILKLFFNPATNTYHELR
ncbi:CFA20 domain-containing protein [Plasmodiophora brassicae]